MWRWSPPSLCPADGNPLPGHNPTEGGRFPWFVSAALIVPRLICLMLFVHFIRLAASRIFWTAGSSRPIRMAMMAITTSSSISVKPGRTSR